MEILGHSQISVTMNTYSHVLPEMQGGAAELRDGFLGEGVRELEVHESSCCRCCCQGSY